ncbi:MAG: GtrA family protein, partial [Clostridia bacterium]|nr:GtrA family protein [Clostridia bacterium]
FELILLLIGTDNSVTFRSYIIEPEKIANTAAVVIGFIYSFILNRTWAFKSKDNFMRQLILMIILLAFNTVISNEAISIMGRNLLIPFVIAKPIMQIAVAVWNYFIYDKIIYRS